MAAYGEIVAHTAYNVIGLAISSGTKQSNVHLHFIDIPVKDILRV